MSEGNKREQHEVPIHGKQDHPKSTIQDGFSDNETKLHISLFATSSCRTKVLWQLLQVCRCVIFLLDKLQ